MDATSCDGEMGGWIRLGRTGATGLWAARPDPISEAVCRRASSGSAVAPVSWGLDASRSWSRALIASKRREARWAISRARARVLSLSSS